MSGKITSVAELKKTVESVIDVFNKNLFFEGYSGDNENLKRIRELINEFELELKKRLEWNETMLDNGESRRIGAIEELRRVLGGGGGR